VLLSIAVVSSASPDCFLVACARCGSVDEAGCLVREEIVKAGPEKSGTPWGREIVMRKEKLRGKCDFSEQFLSEHDSRLVSRKWACNRLVSCFPTHGNL
jgi:hypothetical protein